MAYLYTTAGIRGIGDALFISAVAHEIRNRYGEFIAIRNKNYPLFYNNPSIDLILAGYDEDIRGPKVVKIENRKLCQIVGSRWFLGKIAETGIIFGSKYNAHHGWPPNKPLLIEVAERCDLKLTDYEAKKIRPFFYPYKSELQEMAPYQRTICIQSTSATYWTPNKQWPVKRLQKVVLEICKHSRVIQLGAVGDIPLDGAEYLCGKTSLREAASILANSKLFVGMEGGLMHLARAVDTRSVIIYTGFITPAYSGYHINFNLLGAQEKANYPCWNREKCNCDCAERVTVPMVLNGIDWALSQPVLDKHWKK